MSIKAEDVRFVVIKSGTLLAAAAGYFGPKKYVIYDRVFKEWNLVGDKKAELKCIIDEWNSDWQKELALESKKLRVVGGNGFDWYDRAIWRLQHGMKKAS